jgi:hypothetical protein
MWEALDEELHREVEDGGERMPMLRFTYTLANSPPGTLGEGQETRYFMPKQLCC